MRVRDAKPFRVSPAEHANDIDEQHSGKGSLAALLRAGKDQLWVFQAPIRRQLESVPQKDPLSFGQHKELAALGIYQRGLDKGDGIEQQTSHQTALSACRARSIAI